MQETSNALQARLTQHQLAQLQDAFPQLSTVLPSELKSGLASDTETGSQEAGDSDGWMESDDDDLSTRWGG